MKITKFNQKKMEIILASNSPRRKKILSELGYKFIILPSGIDEENKNNLSPDRYVVDTSERKAFSVWKKHKDYAVISGDTIVNFENSIIGKPKSDKEAFTMIKQLSGKKHYVISALSLIIDGNINNINKEYLMYVDEFELLILREVCFSHVKYGAEMVGFNLKRKIHECLLSKDLKLEQELNEILWNIDRSREIYKKQELTDAQIPDEEIDKVRKSVDQILKDIDDNTSWKS